MLLEWGSVINKLKVNNRPNKKLSRYYFFITRSGPIDNRSFSVEGVYPPIDKKRTKIKKKFDSWSSED